MSSIAADTAPVTSIPESVGEVMSMDSNVPAAKLPPISIPFSAPVIAPFLKVAVPLSLR